MDVESLQAFCNSLPAVTESIKWESDLVFSVGTKMFCIAALEHPYHYSFKVPVEEFEELITHTGIQPAAYFARALWISVGKEAGWTSRKWQQYIRQSYDLIVEGHTRKEKERLGLG